MDSGDAAGDLGHADVDDGDLSDVFVIGIDDDDLSGGDCTQERFAVVGRSLIVGDELGLVQVIGAGYLIDVLYDSIHRSVPSVVEEGAQEGLIDRPSLKQVDVVLLLELGCREHVTEGVDIVLEPKVIRPPNVLLWLEGEDEGSGLAGVDDDVVRVGSVGRPLPYRPGARLEESKKPLVPVLKSVVRLLGVANVLVIFYLFSGISTEPSVRLLLIHEFQG